VIPMGITLLESGLDTREGTVDISFGRASGLNGLYYLEYLKR
jgi:hypothetical protein